MRGCQGGYIYMYLYIHLGGCVFSDTIADIYIIYQLWIQFYRLQRYDRTMGTIDLNKTRVLSVNTVDGCEPNIII